jgi:hypothetical protein
VELLPWNYCRLKRKQYESGLWNLEHIVSGLEQERTAAFPVEGVSLQTPSRLFRNGGGAFERPAPYRLVHPKPGYGAASSKDDLLLTLMAIRFGDW